MEVPWFLSLHWWLTYLLTEYEQEPGHVLVELFCFVVILYLVFRDSYDPKTTRQLSKKEEEELIVEWVPEPLCPVLDEATVCAQGDFLVAESGPGSHVTVNGKECLNAASFNFLGLAGCDAAKEAAREAIEKYGVGSCGPRGFYGSIDVHIKFEQAMTKFSGVTDSILYSDGLACVSSIIPAFAKRGDLIICDDSVHYGIQQGIALSRSSVLYFRHNDLDDLELTLQNVAEKDARMPQKKLNRRFIIVEGISQYHGDICPLNAVIQLKRKYKYRVVLDDSLAFGVLGDTGRGTPEHTGVSITDVDFYCVTADCALATTGGFCMGSEVVTDHQRLSGSGYCFSASSPPFCSAVGIAHLAIMDGDTSMCADVRRKAALLREALEDIDGVNVTGDKESPVLHLRLANTNRDNHRAEAELFRNVHQLLLDKQVLVELPAYIPVDKQRPPPSIRLCVTTLHSDDQLRMLAQQVMKAFRTALGGPLG